MTPEERTTYLGDVINAGGFGGQLRHLEVEPRLLAELRPYFGLRLNFTCATFIEGVQFGKQTVEIAGDSTFRKVSFDGPANFHDVRFTGDVSFSGAQFKHAPIFTNTTFKGRANFDGAWFGSWPPKEDASTTEPPDPTSFHKAAFTGEALFHQTTFAGKATFTDVKFQNGVYFTGVGTRFASGADFTDATFRGEVQFKAEFCGPAAFNRATFLERAIFSECNFSSPACFAEARFSRDVDLSPSGVSSPDESSIDMSSAIFTDSAYIKIDRPLILESAVIRFPLALITGGRAAELQSLVQATLEAPLTLGPGVRVDRCKLAHATGLDKLRVASEPGWARERYRIVLAEEKSRKVRAGPGARTVEASYRQLRASSEASKAAPAANEFYYGEMEMRRAAARSERHWFEWMLLSLYKSTSGYGLRASRAFVTYVCVLLSATCLFWHANDHGWIVQNTMIAGGGGVNFDHFGEVFVKLVTRSSVSFFSPIDTAGLRSSGVVILLGLRLLAPAYLTLAILAVRARIQR